jgi:calcium-dependent protein kinase
MDHPNVARLVDVYESENRLSFVMECMEGGELFDRLLDKIVFGEADAATATLQMLLAINYMHSCGLVHRDLKLENFLFEHGDSNALKLIDFGFSKAWNCQGSNMDDQIGTPAYAAPEVLDGSYTSQCDLWSLGVIVFMLLSGYMPFREEETHMIKQGRYEWRPDRWSDVSDVAVDFVKKLLTVDPNQRLTAAQALEHPWLAQPRAREERKQREQFDRSVAEALSNFSSKSSHNRLFLGLMTWSLAPAEHAYVREAFRMLDQRNTGVIHLDDFIKALAQFGVPEQDCCTTFGALDVNGNGQVDYSEFLAAMMTSQLPIDDDLLKKTFGRFDGDHDGFISLDELNEIIGDPEQSRIIMKQVDQNFDNQISYPEFVQALSRL